MGSSNACLLRLLVAVYCFIHASAQIDLGAAIPYGVTANTAITNTGNTVINGRLALANFASSITGFPPGLSRGIDAANDAARLACEDSQAAYNAAAGLIPTRRLGANLGNRVLTPGTYAISSSADLNGALVLDGLNNLDSQFVFQIGSTLTTATASTVRLVNGAQACNVFWQVGSSATLGTDTVFAGNILAFTSITLNNGVNVGGGLYALYGAVTLINDLVTPQQDCLVQPVESPPYSGPDTSTTRTTNVPGTTSTSSAVVLSTTSVVEGQLSSVSEADTTVVSTPATSASSSIGQSTAVVVSTATITSTSVTPPAGSTRSSTSTTATSPSLTMTPTSSLPLSSTSLITLPASTAPVSSLSSPGTSSPNASSSTTISTSTSDGISSTISRDSSTSTAASSTIASSGSTTSSISSTTYISTITIVVSTRTATTCPSASTITTTLQCSTTRPMETTTKKCSCPAKTTAKPCLTTVKPKPTTTCLSKQREGQ